MVPDRKKVKNVKDKLMQHRIPRRTPCGHCHSMACPVSCHKCMREMCEDCISYASDGSGKVCGLCADRIYGYEQYLAQIKEGIIPRHVDFDTWYDQNG